MGITTNFDMIERETQLQGEALYERIVASFERVGLNFVKDAREQVQDHALGTYVDQTANLRNSIGYYILQNGQIISYNQGGQSGNSYDLIKDAIIPDFKGFQLILLAGMNYASYVESKGYNVISYQADTCLVSLAHYLETLEVIEKGSAARLEESFIPGLSEESFSMGLDD